MLRSWRDVTVATIILLLSQLLQHIKPLSSQQNDFFCREIKGDASAEGIPVVVVLQGLSLSLTLSLNAPSAVTFLAKRLLLSIQDFQIPRKRKVWQKGAIVKGLIK